MFDSVVQQMAHHVERLYIYIYSYICARASLGRKWSIARTLRSTSYDPNLIQHESGTHFMSIPDCGDEDLRGIANSQLEEAIFYKSGTSCSSNGMGKTGSDSRAALSECNIEVPLPQMLKGTVTT